MASNRPAWFRLSSMRPTAPPLGPPPAPAPALVRPAFPVRPPPPPTQTQQPAPPPSLPPTAPPSPQGPAVTAPPSPPAAPPMSPVAPPAPLAAPPPTSPTMLPPPPQASPPRARSATPAPKSPTPARPTPSPPASPMTKSSLTTSTKFLGPSSSSLPTSPSTSKITSPVVPTEPVNVKAATPVSSPKIVKFSENSPLQSPKLKPQSHPPSPLKLPPPQIIASEGEREPKIEEKDVLVQDKPMKIHNNPHNHANATIGKRQEPPMKGKKLSNSEESGTRMITIAGDNKGAVMEITPSHRRTAGAHSLHNKEKSEKETTVQTQAKTTSLNSNVQGVNNSIVFNSDSHHNDPGIHLCVVRKVNGGRYKD